MPNVFPLTNNPQKEGYNPFKDDPRIITPVEKGRPKMRHRTTSVFNTYEVSYLLSTADKSTLETFFDTVIASSPPTFQWTHPETAATIDVEFLSKPQAKPRGIMWLVSFKLGEVPS